MLSLVAGTGGDRREACAGERPDPPRTEGSLKEGAEVEDASRQRAHLTPRKATSGSPPHVPGCAHSGLSSHSLAKIRCDHGLLHAQERSTCLHTPALEERVVA